MNTFFRVSLLFASILVGLLTSAITWASPTAEVTRGEVIRGVVKASQEAMVSVQLKARVTETPIKTGDSFKKNDVLLRFDCDRLYAQARASDADFRVKKAKYLSDKELEKYGAIGKLDLTTSEAEMDGARARVNAALSETKYCNLKAPFNGKVAEHDISVFEMTSSDQPLMKIVSMDDYELHLIVPSEWLSWIKPGSAFDFELDETGVSLSAAVTAIGAEVDAISRTVAVIARFDEHPKSVLPGMSGSARFSTKVGMLNE